MAIDYNELNDILSKIQKIKVDQLGDLNQRIKDFSKYREEQDQKMDNFFVECGNRKNKTQKENESVIKKYINESQITINDMKQNIINMKSENTKWKNSLTEEQDQKLEKITIDSNNWKNKIQKENESVMNKHINESQTIINDIKQNIINMKGENTKWKNSLIEEQDQKLNEMKSYIKENIILTNKKIENQTKELAKLAKKTKNLQIFIYYILGPVVLLITGFLIYSIKFIF